MAGFQCLESAVAVKYVGVYGLIISAVMINLLAQDLLRQGNSTTVIEVILGLQWRDFVPFEDRNQPQGQLLPIILFVYSIVYMITCLLLIVSSLFYSSYLTLPWFICETLSLSSQICALVIHIFHEDNIYKAYLIISATFYIVISICCWTIVFLGQRNWGQSADVPLQLNDTKINNCEMDVFNGISPLK